MLCCCCWPAYRCSISLAIIDTAIAALLWFRSVDLLFGRFQHADVIDVFVFIVLFGLLVCESLATGALVLSQRRKLSRYVSPRLVLLGGQLVVTVLASVLIALYFGGLSHSVNEFIISCYEYWSGLELSESERKTAYNELSTYMAGLLVLLFVFSVYNVFELYITRKYQTSLDQFLPLSQNEPSQGAVPAGPAMDKPLQRPPPYNPQYAPAPPYKR